MEPAKICYLYDSKTKPYRNELPKRELLKSYFSKNQNVSDKIQVLEDLN